MTCSMCQINQRVKTRGFEGYIRFIGNTKVWILSLSMNLIGSSRLLHLSQQFRLALQFAPGEWIGIELDEPEGKNNGTVAGERVCASSCLYMTACQTCCSYRVFSFCLCNHLDTCTFCSILLASRSTGCLPKRLQSRPWRLPS